MSIFEFSALAGALCWAITSVLAAGPVGHIGPVAFTRIRMTMVFVMLAAWVAWTGGWRGTESVQIAPIVLSGVVGIFLGDTAIFMTMNRLGPRRTSILFATNAPMSVVLAWALLGEKLGQRDLTGIGLVFLGVVLAIVFGKRKSQLHKWESIKGALWIGVAIGLFSALCQSAGSLIMRPVMAAGADPATVSMLRVGVSVACFYAAYLVRPEFSRALRPMTWPVASLIALSGFLAMALGMTLILFALSGGEVGIVATLSATTPALVLPLIWMNTREAPAAGAWAGAALVVAGTWLISTG